MPLYNGFFFAGREDKKLTCIETYLRAVKMFRNFDIPEEDPVFSEVIPLSTYLIIRDIFNYEIFSPT